MPAPRWMRAVLLALPLFALALPVVALDLDQAKASGAVGERLNGYLGAVGQASAEVAALVEDINARRREHYAEIAQKNGTSVKAVAALAGAKLVKKASPGEYVEKADGSWVKKGP